MKNRTKRGLALVLVLVLCLSLLPALNLPGQAAAVDYVYAGDYIKNWGTRDTTATFLSPNGEKFYADNQTSYEELASLSGSTSTSSVPSSPLYRELQDLMVSNHSYETTYDATRNLYQYTDCQNSGKTSDKISSFYSGTAIGPAWDGGSTWNREHTWPNSKGLNGQDENDIMMLRPTSKSENSSRGNTAYGEGSGYYDPNKHGMHLRGDVARIMLYQYVRWGNTSYMWGTGGVMESREVLLKWMAEDPVDTWELGRNDAVESITGTRNVFVDYPELAFVLFGAQVPANYVSPSGSASGSSYRITVLSNNDAWGTVSLSGSTINTIPATGYQVSGYTLLSGTAEITRSGNAFIVKPSTDVTVQIDFAARNSSTVQFMENGTIVGSQTAYSGDDVTLPAHKGTLQTGHTFVGWVENVVQDATSMPQVYLAGSRYTVTQNQTLYALYSRNESGGPGNSNVFTPYSGQLIEGDYVVVYKNPNNGDTYAMAAKMFNGRLQHQAFSYTGSDIISPDAGIIWHVAPNGSHWTMYNEEASVYAGGTGVKNKAGLLTSLTDYAKWSVTGKDTYVFINKGNKDNNVNPRLTQNGSVGFACYADSSNSVGGPLSLYKRVSGTIYYFTGGTGAPMRGDLDGNGMVTEDDAIYLLQHVLLPEFFPVTENVDFDSSGEIDEDDAIYLLQHVLLPEFFPLS